MNEAGRARQPSKASLREIPEIDFKTTVVRPNPYAPTKKRYGVRFDREADSGWWVVTVPEIQGCLTQGRSIAEGRRRIREAMALFIGEAEAGQATLVDDVRLPPAVRRQVRRVASVKERAEKFRAQAEEATRAAASHLTGQAGLSVRDAAEMLGISFQRVQQLVGSGQAKGSG